MPETLDELLVLLRRFLESGGGKKLRLYSEHFGRIENARVDEFEALVFDVERHPHVFDCLKHNPKTAASRRVDTTYRFWPGGRIVQVDERDLPPRVHYAALVDEFVATTFRVDTYFVEELRRLPEAARYRHAEEHVDFETSVRGALEEADAAHPGARFVERVWPAFLDRAVRMLLSEAAKPVEGIVVVR